MIIGFKPQFQDKITAGTKKTTIRNDKHDRWHSGMTMHMATGVRTKNYNCFKLDTCKSTQKIRIWHRTAHVTYVYIDGRCFAQYRNNEKFPNIKLVTLANNDGFDSVESFFEWFNKDFTGKLIHWTDLRY